MGGYTMNAITLLFATLAIFAVAYRFYGLFIAKKVLVIDPDRKTPAIRFADGHDYVETNKSVVFGHHFAAIAAAGPLLGPVLAAQFGYLPGALWIIIGCVLGGAVHDMVILYMSMRHKGQGLARIAELEIDKLTGGVAAVAILFILILTLAGLSIAVVNALFGSPWGTFTVAMTIPIAVIMGLYMRKIRPGDVKGASIIGVILLLITILVGPQIVANPALAEVFTFSKSQLSIMIAIYGIFASILPVWLLLVPRDYLSTYLKLGTIAMLACGIVFVAPTFQMPALTQFVHGGGPIIPGAVFPFVFITIACGAISGFHSIIATGTTPKMVSTEKHIPFVGYGAMLTEGVVAIMALIAACVLVPADYFAINSTPEAFAQLGMTTVHLPELAQAVGENVQGRPGGAVSLAIGMSYIFSSIPFMKHLVAYWYHFAIMFEAVFILTAIDAGTRVGRFFLQEALGKFHPKFGEINWMPGVVITSLLFTASWGYLLYTGDISTIWPLFGMSNQLLAACGLIIATTMLIRKNKLKYIWVTLLPALFMVAVTFTASYQNIFNNYLPKGKYLLSSLGGLVVILMMIVFVGAVRKWIFLLQKRETLKDEFGESVLEIVNE